MSEAVTSRAFAILLVVTATLYVFEIDHGLPNRDITWAYDSNPLYPLIVAKRVFLDGWNTGFHGPYPNFHHFFLLIFFTPYMLLQWILGNLDGLKMGGGYPYGIANFDLIFMHLTLLTRSVNVFMGLGITYWTYRIGKTLHSPTTGVYAAGLVAFSPAITYYVHTETLDIPMLFWLTPAIYYYLRVIQTFSLPYYIGLATLAAVSTATKDYAYGAFVLLPIPMVTALARKFYGRISAKTLWSALLDQRHLIGFLVFLMAVAIAENWLWNFSGFVNHIKLAGGLASTNETGLISTQLGRTDMLTLDRLRSIWIMLRFVLGWLGAPACLAGLLIVFVRQYQSLRLLIWPLAGLYVFTYVQVSPGDSVIERPLMTTAPLFAVFGGALLQHITANLRKRHIGRLICVSVLIGCFLNALAVDFVLINDTRYQAEDWVARKVKPHAVIDLYGRRMDVPRIDDRWSTLVISDRGWDKSDVRLSEEYTPQEVLRAREPDYVIVAGEYRRQVFGRREERASRNLAKQMRFFFEQLDQGSLGYTEQVRFVPNAAIWLRFPRYLRREIIIYGKKA